MLSRSAARGEENDDERQVTIVFSVAKCVRLPWF